MACSALWADGGEGSVPFRVAFLRPQLTSLGMVGIATSFEGIAQHQAVSNRSTEVQMVQKASPEEKKAGLMLHVYKNQENESFDSSSLPHFQKI